MAGPRAAAGRAAAGTWLSWVCTTSGRQDQGRRVGEERNPQAEPGQQAAHNRAADVADQERGGVGAGDPAAAFRRRQPDHERHGSDREHHRARAAQPAEDQQLPVVLGEGAGRRGGRHDQQARHVDRPFAQPADQGPAGRGEHQPHEREDAHDHGGGRRADVESRGELRQDRRNKAETQRNQERRGQHHLDVAGQPVRPVPPAER